MSLGTSIAWSDATWNPIVGCTHAAYQPETGQKVAHPGCDHCYAETWNSRPFPGMSVHNETSKNGKWTGQTRFIPARLLDPFTGSLKPRRDGMPRRVFLTSLSDIWHPSFDNQTRMAIHGAMLLSPWNIYQDLTKRPGVAAEWLSSHTPVECVWAWRDTVIKREFVPTWDKAEMGPMTMAADWYSIHKTATWPDFDYIHRYCSVSDQATANALIPHLLRMPAAVHGISAEPLLGPINLSPYLVETSYGVFPGGDPRQFEPDPDASTTDEQQTHRQDCLAWEQGEGKNRGPQCATMGDGSVWDGTGYGLGVWHNRHLDHVIVGGESGHKARPCHLEWIEDIIGQCYDAGCPVFVKQLGKMAILDGRPYPTVSSKGSDPGEWPGVLRVQQNVGDL